jgi:hypothetical protein
MFVLHERQIHASLAYLTLAAALLTIGFTVCLILSQYKRASRSLSRGQGARRRRLVILFLGLAVVCFSVVTGLNYVDSRARAEVVDILAGGFGEDGDTDGVFGEGKDKEMRKRFWWVDGGGRDAVQVEVPSA